MPTLAIPQSWPDGPPHDQGLRDGRFLYNAQPSPHDWGATYWRTSELRPGHLYVLTGQGVERSAISANWLRFSIPMEADANIVFDRAYLNLHWNATESLPIGHPNRTANKGRGNNGDEGIAFRLFRNYPPGTQPFDQLPVPQTVFEGINFYNLVGRMEQWVWKDDTILHAPAEFIGPVVTNNFAEELQRATINSPGWQPDDVVTFFMSGQGDLQRTYERVWRFCSYSWNGQFNGGDHTTSPGLIIEYHYETPKPNEIAVHVEHILDLGQFFEETTISACYISDLTIFQTIGVEIGYSRTIEHELEIEQTIHRNETTFKDVQHLLFIQQDISGGRVYYNFDVEHVLTINQDITTDTRFFKQVFHDLSIEQDVIGSRDYEKEVIHFLDISQLVHPAGTAQVNIQQQLVITQVIDVEFCPANYISHTLLLEQEINVSVVWCRPVEQTLPLTQVLLGYILRDGSVGTPTQCGTNSLEYAPAGFGDKPTLTINSTVTFEYPETSPTYTVVFPSPLLGNQEEKEITRISRQTRGGNVIVFRDPSWGTNEIWKLGFSGLTTTQKENFFTFLGASLGQKIKYTDHEGRSWLALIVNPNGESSQVHRDCGFTYEVWLRILEEI